MSKEKSQTLFKYSQEKLEKKINKEEDIKMKQKQFTAQLEIIEALFFPKDAKIYKDKHQIELIDKYKGIQSFKCSIYKAISKK